MAFPLIWRMMETCPRSEMDITTAFEAVIAGSTPAEGDKVVNFEILFIIYSSGKAGLPAEAASA